MIQLTQRDIIAAERGRHFDPAVVDAFLAGFDEFVAVAGRYLDAAVMAPSERVPTA